MYNRLSDRTEEYRKGKIRLAWLFGLVASLVFAVVGWGFDGLQLSQANGIAPLAKLAMGILPVIFVCMLAAWLSALLANGFASFFFWLICGAIIALIGIVVSVAGMTWFYGWADPAVAARLHYAVDSGIATRLVLTVGICAAIGAIAGLFFNTLLENCFASASVGGAILILLTWAVFFAACGFTLEKTVERPMRAPVVAIDQSIVAKLEDEVTPYSRDQERDLHLGALNSVQDLLHSKRQLVLLDYDDTLSMTHVGINFDGTWVQCMVAANNYLIPPLQQPVDCRRMD